MTIEDDVKETKELTKQWYDESNKSNEEKQKYGIISSLAAAGLIAILLIIFAGVLGYSYGYSSGYDAATNDITRKIILSAIGIGF